jgi:hypothetical protein
MRLTSIDGAVSITTANGTPLPDPSEIPPGGTIRTFGPVSRALLSYPDGTGIAFAGDSMATLDEDGHRLVLHEGSASANFPRRPEGAVPLTLATPEATLDQVRGVLMTLGRVLQGTEVGVQHGLVRVLAPSGEALAEVREGELLTVRADGSRYKRPMPLPPDQFTWDLSRSRPVGWYVGHAELTPEGPYVRPELWFDPYHQSEMFQIRSESQWAPALFRLFPESLIRVRYWVERPGPSQVVICVRTIRAPNPASGVLEVNEAFAQARPRQWQWLEVKAKDMLANRHTPNFGAPWVGFLVIFNTYQVDLGLRISEFEVVPPTPQTQQGGKL